LHIKKEDSATKLLGSIEEIITIPAKQKAFFKVENICDAS